MDTATVTGSPNSALVGGFGVTVTVAPEFDPLLKYSLTRLVTSVDVAPSNTAYRALSREAFVSICWTITIRPYSQAKHQPEEHRRNHGKLNRSGGPSFSSV